MNYRKKNISKNYVPFVLLTAMQYIHFYFCKYFFDISLNFLYLFFRNLHKFLIFLYLCDRSNEGSVVFGGWRLYAITLVVSSHYYRQKHSLTVCCCIIIENSEEEPQLPLEAAADDMWKIIFGSRRCELYTECKFLFSCCV